MITDEGERNLLVPERDRINVSDQVSFPSGDNVRSQALTEAQIKKKKVIKWSIIGGSIALAVILAIVLIVVLTKKSGDNPGPGPDPPGPPGPPPMPIYPAYNPYSRSEHFNNHHSVYGFITAEEQYNPELHVAALQSLVAANNTPDTHVLTINPAGIPSGINNELVKNVSYEFHVADYYTGCLRLADAKNERFEIPVEQVPTKARNNQMRLDMFKFNITNEPFAFELLNQYDHSEVLLSTKNSSLVFMDKYIQMDFQLPSQKIYGFGEREHSFNLGEGTWTMWSKKRDNSSYQYDVGTGGLQGQGVHPFVLVETKTKGEYFGLFFRNSNAQSPMIKFREDGRSSLSYITTGGIIELYIFQQGTAKTILKAYHTMIGKPQLPPFWALGWGQASTQYKNASQILDVINKYEAAGIPLNTIYLDIHSLQDYTSFYVDNVAFKDLSKVSQELHNKKRQLIGIVESALNANETGVGDYYKQAQDAKILIKSAINENKDFNGALVTKGLNEFNVFIDWFNTNTQQIYAKGLKAYFAQTQFDGLWLDNDTPFGYFNGEISQGAKPVPQQLEEAIRFLSEHCLKADDPYEGWYQSYRDQDEISTYNLPFIPGYKAQGNLDTHTISLNATHVQTNVTEYNLHNLNALAQIEHTWTYLKYNKDFIATQGDNIPFILSRSSYPSSGRFASHFVSSQRSWLSLKYSISSLMNFNMYGIPHTGTDVCGYFGDEFNEEICARWIQLATFYPLARINYQTLANDVKGNEPYQLTGEWLKKAKAAIIDRHQYLRHMYTCLFEVSQYGGTCFDPLFYDYFSDNNVYKDVDHTFLVGQALKVSPVLDAGVETTFKSYFPKGRWVNIHDHKEVIDGSENRDLKDRSTVNVHLRPGYLIPFQNVSALPYGLNTTNDLHEVPISIIINRDVGKVAHGSLYLSKGHSASEINDKDYEYYTIHAQANTIQKHLVSGKHGNQKAYVDKFQILDAKDLKTVDTACFFDNHLNVVPLTTSFNADTNVLTITSEEPLLFSKFRQVMYGNKTTDLDLCSKTTYNYKVKDATQVDLTKNHTSFVISHNSAILPDLRVNISFTNANTVNVKWTFADESEFAPYRVPHEVISTQPTGGNQKLSNYVTVNTGPIFKIEILNAEKNAVHTINSIVFDRLFNFVGSTSHSVAGDNFKGIFGLGERSMQKNSLFYGDGVYTVWAADHGTPIDDGIAGGKNQYGMHPFFMYQNEPEVWVGVFSKIAAAQDWYVQNYPNTGKVDTTMVAVGGVADLYYIVATTPGEVVDAYMDIVGKPTLPPFWALGWHQSKWGYNSTDQLRAVVKGYQDNGIPLDTIWNDIDYMHNYRNFEPAQEYGDLAKFTKDIKAQGVKYVPILDAGIALRPESDYKAFDDGVKQDVFIKVRDEILVGAVWPKEAAFPDWFAKNTASWWGDQLTAFRKIVNFDGIWLDMNEATNFCNGVCVPDQKSNPNRKNLVRYTPSGKNLEDMSIPLDVVHANNASEWDVHGLFGTLESKATAEWFTANHQRPFVLTRSSFAGAGKYAFKWLGDNRSTLESMTQSVIGTMMMNIFGIPFSGSDICGYAEDTQDELCARWHFVGSFQPFSRNHNQINRNPQEPYTFKDKFYEDGVTYMSIMQKAIVQKYKLLNYYYTQLQKMSSQGTGPVYTPVFFQFPDDPVTYIDVVNNVMIGDALKVSVLASALGQNTTEFYFPAGTWCNIFDPKGSCITSAKGANVTLPSKASDSYVHIREGKIVPINNFDSTKLRNTADITGNPIDLNILGKAVATSPDSWRAKGEYYNDDSSVIEGEQGNFNLYAITANGGTTGGKTQITITIHTTSGTQPANPNDPNDFSLNGNDKLNSIILHNVAAYSALKFTVSILPNVGEEVYNVGSATFDKVSNRLVIKPSKTETLLLSYIGSIVLTTA